VAIKAIKIIINKIYLELVCAANISLPVRAESPVKNILVQNTGANEYFQQGLSLAAKQDTEGAEAAFRRAIQIDPNLAEAYANLGSLLANQNKLEEAVPNFQTAIRLKPNVPEFHYMFGQVLYAQDKVSDAVESFKKARDCSFMHEHNGTTAVIQVDYNF